MPAKELEALRTSTRTGRPFGAGKFVERLERTLGRVLRRRKPGPTALTKPRLAKPKERR
jgi:hypothetical protein